MKSRKPPIMAFYLKYNQHIVKTQPYFFNNLYHILSMICCFTGDRKMSYYTKDKNKDNNHCSNLCQGCCCRHQRHQERPLFAPLSDEDLKNDFWCNNPWAHIPTFILACIFFALIIMALPPLASLLWYLITS